MATHGKDSYFEIDTVDLTTYLNSVEVNTSVDTSESSTMGQNAKTFVQGMTEGDISIAGNFDSTATVGPDAALRALSGEVDFVYGPEGDAATKTKVSGTCIKTAYNRSSPVGDIVAFSATFKITGPVTEGTFSA